MPTAIPSPLPQFFDLDGKPLAQGKIYIGLPNQNPETNPVTVYWDAAGTQPAAQPLRTKGGYVFRNGTPAAVYAPDDYSITVRNRNGELVYSLASSLLFSGTSQLAQQVTTLTGQLTALTTGLASATGTNQIGYKSKYLGSVLQLLKFRLDQWCMVTDFPGADGNPCDTTGVVDCTEAIRAAHNAYAVHAGNDDLTQRRAVYYPPGDYKNSGIQVVRKGQVAIFEVGARLRHDHLTGLAQSWHTYWLGYGLTGIVSAGSLVAGKTYVVKTVGTSNFTSVGSLTNNVGQTFVATGAGTGTGTVYSLVQDPGGLPPVVWQMNAFGGTDGATIFCDVAGHRVQNCFLTAVGIGIISTGTDGFVDGNQIDQAQVGFYFGGIHSSLTNNKIYRTKNHIILAGGFYNAVASCVIVNNIMSFAEFGGVTFPAGITYRNNTISGNLQVQNDQYPGTYQGAWIYDCSGQGIDIVGGGVANQYGPAHVSRGFDNVITYRSVKFDGKKTEASHTQSTTSTAAKVSKDIVSFVDCDFVDLLDSPIEAIGNASFQTGIYVTDSRKSDAMAATTPLIKISGAVPTNQSWAFCTGLETLTPLNSIFSASASGWHLGTEDGYVLTGLGATLIPQWAGGRESTYFINTTSAAALVRLPRTADSAAVRPRNGDKLIFVPYSATWNTNNVTLDRGDNNIEGAAANKVLNTNTAYRLIYNSATSDWRPF